MIALIWAMSSNRVIGKDGKLPWRAPEDLAYFKRVTQGGVVVMGRKTFESIGQPLPERTNVVLTSNPEQFWDHPRILAFDSIEDVLKIRGREIFIIGGAEIYKQFLPYAAKLYVTHIPQQVEGDTFFPEYDETEWQIEDVSHGRNLTFEVYRRVSNG